MSEPLSEERLTEIRGRCDRIGEKLGRYEAFGSGWELSYAIDLPALLAEVDRLRAQLAAYNAIEQYRLIVRPTVTGQYGAGRFARVSLNNRMEAIPETWTEASTLDAAIREAVEKTRAALGRDTEQ
jgi:hypothetical protein